MCTVGDGTSWYIDRQVETECLLYQGFKRENRHSLPSCKPSSLSCHSSSRSSLIVQLQTAQLLASSQSLQSRQLRINPPAHPVLKIRLSLHPPVNHPSAHNLKANIPVIRLIVILLRDHWRVFGFLRHCDRGIRTKSVGSLLSRSCSSLSPPKTMMAASPNLIGRRLNVLVYSGSLPESVERER